jgi:hypothetical protein
VLVKRDDPRRSSGGMKGGEALANGDCATMAEADIIPNATICQGVFGVMRGRVEREWLFSGLNKNNEKSGKQSISVAGNSGRRKRLGDEKLKSA